MDSSHSFLSERPLCVRQKRPLMDRVAGLPRWRYTKKYDTEPRATK